jgi:ADP-ribose pyrophosphatase YjhB (NUDIX family)
MRRYAGVVATSDDFVLLVCEPYDDGTLHWGIPGGRVEEDESFAEGATRELFEETGLMVSPAELEEISRVELRTTDGVESISTNFTVEVPRHDVVNRDPDGIVAEAAWFPIERALALLAEVDYLPLVEPVLYFLESGEKSAWSYVDPLRRGVRS